MEPQKKEVKIKLVSMVTILGEQIVTPSNLLHPDIIYVIAALGLDYETEMMVNDYCYPLLLMILKWPIIRSHEILIYNSTAENNFRNSGLYITVCFFGLCVGRSPVSFLALIPLYLLLLKGFK